MGDSHPPHLDMGFTSSEPHSFCAFSLGEKLNIDCHIEAFAGYLLETTSAPKAAHSPLTCGFPYAVASFVKARQEGESDTSPLLLYPRTTSTTNTMCGSYYGGCGYGRCGYGGCGYGRCGYGGCGYGGCGYGGLGCGYGSSYGCGFRRLGCGYGCGSGCGYGYGSRSLCGCGYGCGSGYGSGFGCYY
ncbi:loricrin-like [Neovison vison]|uniref:loricrin-like n=1 Tax=Neovison vison TaxID=452646 RepID=UPI001CF043CF|nr:loricrin-like [Neogale vison]